jgi:gephyrin
MHEAVRAVLPMSYLLTSLHLITINMSESKLRAAILVVSTTASRDPSQDTSGRILKDVFDEDGAGQWEVVYNEIVGDVVLDIQRTITQWTDHNNPMNLIITTGGTGFATFDNTPEACLND